MPRGSFSAVPWKSMLLRKDTTEHKLLFSFLFLLLFSAGNAFPCGTWKCSGDEFEQLGKPRHRGAGKVRSILFQAGDFPPRLLLLMEKSAEEPPLERGEELKSVAGPCVFPRNISTPKAVLGAVPSEGEMGSCNARAQFQTLSSV